MQSRGIVKRPSALVERMRNGFVLKLSWVLVFPTGRYGSLKDMRRCHERTEERCWICRTAHISGRFETSEGYCRFWGLRQHLTDIPSPIGSKKPVCAPLSRAYSAVSDLMGDAKWALSSLSSLRIEYEFKDDVIVLARTWRGSTFFGCMKRCG